MNKEEVRQKMLDIVGDIYHAKLAEHGLNGYTKFDGHTLDEAKYTINKAFDSIIVDHQKVELPREVGEELDEYKRGFEHDIDVLGFLTDVDNLMELNKTYAWVYESDGDRSDHANRIIDAYRHGWEAEPEVKLYVQTPKEWWEDSAIPEWMHFDTCRGVCSGFSKLGRTSFTRAELKQYHLDSDIFTLVPVEEEK